MHSSLFKLAIASLLTIAVTACSDAQDGTNSLEANLRKANASDAGLSRCKVKAPKLGHDAGVKDSDEADDEALEGDDLDDFVEESESGGGGVHGKDGNPDKAQGKSKCIADDGGVVEEPEGDASVEHGNSGDHGKGSNNGKGNSSGKGHDAGA
jgi:hypothetical protein